MVGKITPHKLFCRDCVIGFEVPWLDVISGGAGYHLVCLTGVVSRLSNPSDRRCFFGRALGKTLFPAEVIINLKFFSPVSVYEIGLDLRRI